MFQALVRTGLTAALLGLALAPGLVLAQDHRVRKVEDGAGMFTEAAREQANRTIAQIAERHHKELMIETIEKLPDKTVPATWSRDRFNNVLKMDGVYVAFCKSPKFFRIEVGNKTTSEGYFPAANVTRLEGIIKDNQSSDEMLKRIVGYVQETMDLHPPKKAKAEAPGGQPAPAPAPAPRGANPQNSSGIPEWVVWACLIVGGLLVIWVIFAVIRAITGSMGGGGYGAGAPGYPPMGYGGGGGGGGFFTSMLGGLFGAMAGMWIYNSFFGGHATHGPNGNVNWGGDGGGTAGTSGGGSQGDTDTGASGGGGDWGGGGAGGDDAAAGGMGEGQAGGDWGGKDRGDAGGDWGGGGGGDAGGGGGDWGGGGGDSGGGGGGGCGGAGCGGGGGGGE